MSSDSLVLASHSKDVVDGLGKGLGSMLKGTLGGAAMMVSAPVAGAYQGSSDGFAGAVKGFGKGLGKGIIQGGSMIATGVSNGAMEVARATPETIKTVKAVMNGLYWDEEKEDWIVYRLKQEAADVLSISTNEYLANRGINYTPPVKTAARKDYCELLGVSSTAELNEIKQAYYLRSRESQSRFEKIGEAYQILCDERLRIDCAANDKSSLRKQSKVDSYSLFTILSGSEKFSHLIGELKIAHSLQDVLGQQPMDPIQTELKKFIQRKREVSCAVILLEKLAVYYGPECHCDPQRYRDWITSDIRDLQGTPIALALLSIIGSCYVEFTKKELSSYRYIGSTIHITQDIYGVAFNELRTAWKGSEKQSRPMSPSSQTAQVSPGTGAGSGTTATKIKNTSKVVDFLQIVEGLGGRMFKPLWKVTIADIQSTLYQVCRRVIYDKDIENDQIRVKRLEALKLLGETFMHCGGSLNKESLSDLQITFGMQFCTMVCSSGPEQHTGNNNHSLLDKDCIDQFNQVIIRLSDEIDSRDDDIHRLVAAEQQLYHRLNVSSAFAVQQQLQLDQLMSRNEKNETELSGNRKLIPKLQLEKANLETALTDSVNKNGKLSSQVENLQSIVAEFERSDFQVYKNEAEARESQNKSKIAQLENDKRSLENSVTAHVNSINQYVEHSNALKQAIQQLETSKKGLESSVSEHVKTINQYSEKSKSLNQTIQGLERFKSLLTENETQYIAKIAQLENDKRGLERSVSEHVKSINQYREQSNFFNLAKENQYKVKIAQLEKDKKGLEISITGYTNQINQHTEELNSFQLVINQLEEDKEFLMNQNQQFSKNLNKMSNKNKNLTKKLDTQKMKISELDTAAESYQAKIDELNRENNENEDEGFCVICREARKTIVLLPCKHMCSCETCCRYVANKCPICRSRVTETMKVYI